MGVQAKVPLPPLGHEVRQSDERQMVLKDALTKVPSFVRLEIILESLSLSLSDWLVTILYMIGTTLSFLKESKSAVARVGEDEYTTIGERAEPICTLI